MAVWKWIFRDLKKGFRFSFIIIFSEMGFKWKHFNELEEIGGTCFGLARACMVATKALFPFFNDWG